MIWRNGFTNRAQDVEARRHGWPMRCAALPLTETSGSRYRSSLSASIT
jgi:hypothetical protein